MRRFKYVLFLENVILKIKKLLCYYDYAKLIYNNVIASWFTLLVH